MCRDLMCAYQNRAGECAKKTKHYPADAACIDEEEEYEARRAHEERLQATADHILNEWKEEGSPALWRGREMPRT